MAKKNIKHIFIVDDNPKVLMVICDTLEQEGFEVSCFTNGIKCLEAIDSQSFDMLITDLKMPEMDGLELMKKVKERAPWAPVLIITGYGDIPLAVKAVKFGAADFIEKPLEKETFLRKINTILEKNASIAKYFSTSLTNSEAKILKEVLNGKSNREIAESLHRSIRTVEAHRANIMQKFGVESLVELIKRAALMGLINVVNEKTNKKQNKNEN